MLAIGISSLLMINTAGYNGLIETMNQYKNSSFDIIVYSWKADRNFLGMLKKVDGVIDVYGDYSLHDIHVVGKDERITTIKGVDKSKFSQFWRIDFTDEGKVSQIYEELDTGRNILLPQALEDTLGISKGDFIRLKMDTGEKDYKVIGFFDKYMNSTSTALVSERFLKLDMKADSYNCVFVKANDPEKAAESIRNEFKRNHPYVETKEESIAQSIEANNQSMMLMQGFSVLALIIGSFGVINNLLISFIQRKHSLAVFRSVGMSKKQILSMVFIESLTGGLIGGIIGVIAGSTMIRILVGVGTGMEVSYPVSSFFTYIFCGSLVMLIASISPALKSSKIDLVASLKYE
jgi:putative ABC transport system permease protein